MQTTPEISYLFRLENYNNLKENYLKKQIKFSCAANWINYFVKNHSIGDFSEAIFSHIKDCENTKKFLTLLNDFQQDILCIKTSESNFYLNYIPLLKIPCISFYSISHENNFFDDNCFYSFSLENYRSALKYSDNVGVLLIHNVKGFFIDLIKQLEILSSNTPANISLNIKKDLFVAKNIKYLDLKNNEYLSWTCDENLLFRKDISYKWQSEFRIALSNFNFVKTFSTQNYFEQLSISLPNIEKYADIFSLEEFNTFVLKKDKKSIGLSLLKK